MIIAVGVDTVAVARIDRLLQRSGERFLRRVFTSAEQEYCLSTGRPAESLAVRFAAKEAVLKCLGTGWSGGIGFADVEVMRCSNGSVTVGLHGHAAALAARRGVRRVHLSLSHTERDAVAFAVAED